jgi:hypothetical protein
MTDQENDALNIRYLALGRLIAAECPAGFATARLRMEVQGDQTRLWLDSTQPDGTEVQLQPSEAGARDILESLRGIRKAMAEKGGAPWRSCVVTLKAGGHFALEVED